MDFNRNEDQVHVLYICGEQTSCKNNRNIRKYWPLDDRGFPNPLTMLATVEASLSLKSQQLSGKQHLLYDMLLPGYLVCPAGKKGNTSKNASNVNKRKP